VSGHDSQVQGPPAPHHRLTHWVPSLPIACRLSHRSAVVLHPGTEESHIIGTVPQLTAPGVVDSAKGVLYSCHQSGKGATGKRARPHQLKDSPIRGRRPHLERIHQAKKAGPPLPACQSVPMVLHDECAVGRVSCSQPGTLTGSRELQACKAANIQRDSISTKRSQQVPVILAADTFTRCSTS
jgi:hypothetical protein